MSERPIAVGDLVVVVRANPCGCCGGLGRVFVVSEIVTATQKAFCNSCRQVLGPLVAAKREGTDLLAALFRLKRISPLDELESTRTDEKTREPA